VTNTSHQPVHCQISVVPGIQSALRKRHFAQVDGACYRLTDDLAIEQRRFFREWDHLEPDDYLRDGASFRRRRFGLFYLDPGSNELLPLPESTYFQPLDMNRYAGGISRRFAPLRPPAVRSRFLHELIGLLFRQLPIEPDRLSHPWLVDVHQIRITATVKEQGEPAPEGPHHDGEEFGVIQLVQRQNVAGGITTVYSGEEPLSSCTLREPMDTLLLWDPRVMHGVSPISPLDPAEPGIRDTLLIGYDPAPLLERP
jgi:hypothetical protein